jgi:hypothetical protein
MGDLQTITKSAPIENTDVSNPSGFDSVYNSMDVESQPDSPQISGSSASTPGVEIPDDSGCDDTRSPDDVEQTPCVEDPDVVDDVATSFPSSTSSKKKR